MTPSTNAIPPSEGKVRDWGGFWVYASLVGFLAAFLYVAYGAATITGIGGYLMAVQMNIFGSADFGWALLMGVFIGLVVISVGYFLIASVWTRLFGVRAPAPPSPKAAATLQVLLAAPKNGLSWKALLLMAGIPLAVVALVAPVLYFMDHRDQQQPVYDLDLTDSHATLPEGAEFAEINGLIARRYLALYKERVGGVGDFDLQVFAPITAPGWTVADSVRYVVHRTVRQDSSLWDSPVDLQTFPEEFKQRGPVIIPGKLGTSLPVNIKQDFKSDGLTLAPSVQVVEWTELPNHQVPASGSYIVALVIGGAMSFLILFTAPIIKLTESLRRKRDRRRHALANH
jgi:hypothetical protein